MGWMRLLRLLPADLREPIAGDLQEEWERLRQRIGPLRAAAWGWMAAVRVVLAFQIERLTHTRGVPPLAEELRQKRQIGDEIRQDLVFSVRMLRRQPAFTAVALTALAVGIGANTAIFSVVDAVLWRPLPYADADRIVDIAEQRPREGRMYGAVSPADFFDWRREAQSFTQMAAYFEYAVNLTGVGEPERLRALQVTAGFLEALGVVPTAGRTFITAEETDGQNQAVILTDGIWRRRFGADPNVVGRTVTFNGNPYTVVGLLPPSFWWPSPTDVLLPLALNDHDRTLRAAHFMFLIGRLKPNVDLKQAYQELTVIGARLEQQYPEENRGHGPNLRSLRESMVGTARVALLALLGAVGFVLLIACANVATLLLARASVRQQELSIRRALGATRARVVQQMMTESLVVSAIGCGIGLLLAAWSVAAFRTVLPAEFSELPGLDRIGIDARVLLAAVGASLVTGVVFGVLPALVASDTRVHVGLTEEARGSSGSAAASRLRSALVVSELAFSLILLAGAALLIVSFARLTRVSPGFQTDGVVTATLNLPASRYGSHTLAVRFYESVMERLKGAPGVQRVAVTSAVPFSGLDARLNLDIDPPVLELKPPVRAHPRLVSPGYFAAMGIPVIRGRGLDDRDVESTPLVVVINETAVRRYWPNADPIGARISLGQPVRWMEIVGVVGDVRHEALAVDAEPEAYIPLRQGFVAIGVGLDRALALVVRSGADEVSTAAAIRTAVASIDRQQPVGRIRAMNAMIAASIGPERLNYLLVTAFAAVAVVLTAAGLYGVMSYIVAQRTREIGVRMALGASQAQVVGMVMRQAGTMMAGGIAIGIAGALAVTRWTASLLFGVSAADPTIYAVASLLLALVALGAAAVPSRRATRIDPMVALRE
jgi:putative ABC transport system permease protein